MAYIDQPSQIPEPYDLASFSKQESGISRRELIVPRRQMAKQTLGFSSTVFRHKFRDGISLRNYRSNEIIFSQEDKADAVFYIQSGTVKLTMAATRREKAIIAVLLRDSFVGEGCLGGQSLRMYTARSIGPSNITRLQKERTLRTLKRDPQFAALLNAYLLSRVIRVEEDLADQFFNFSEKRLARVLLLFGQITKESKPENPLKVSQATLAEMVGTTRARISKFMNAFKKKGFVSNNGGLQINSALISAFLQNRPMPIVRRAWTVQRGHCSS
jgi:CRP/FNR family cyclic AMP-dependent transcriptional regulator